MFPAANNNEVLFQLLYALAGDKVLFMHEHRKNNVLQGGMDVAPPFRRLAIYYFEHPGLVGSVFSRQRNREFKLKYLKKSWTTTTSFVSRKCMERTSFFKLFRCWLRDFDSLVPFFLTMKMREDRLSAFTGIFCLKMRL